MSTHELNLFQHVAMIASTEMPGFFTEPEDDWEPIAFLELEEGNAIPALPMGMYMQSVQGKELLARMILPMAIDHFGAKRIVLLLSVWMAQGYSKEEIESGEYMAPSKHPERTEHIQLLELTADGVQRHSMAQIIRHEDSPPTLGEWDDLEELENFEGRFIDPLVAALKEVP